MARPGTVLEKSQTLGNMRYQQWVVLLGFGTRMAHCVLVRVAYQHLQFRYGDGMNEPRTFPA